MARKLTKLIQVSFYVIITWMGISLGVGLIVKQYGINKTEYYSEYYFAPGYKNGDIVNNHLCLMPPTGCSQRCLGNESVVGDTPEICGNIDLKCRGILVNSCDRGVTAWLPLLQVVFMPMNIVVN